MQCNKYCKYIGCFSRITVSCAPVPLQESVQFVVPCAYSCKIHLKTWYYVLKLTHLFYGRNATADCAWAEAYLGISNGDLVGVLMQPHLLELADEIPTSSSIVVCEG